MDIVLPCDDQATSINQVLNLFNIKSLFQLIDEHCLQVSFNPNYQSHSWMCICGENGISQLLRVDSSYLPKVADTYLKEMTT